MFNKPKTVQRIERRAKGHVMYYFQSLAPPPEQMNRIIPAAFKWTLALDRTFWKYIFLSQEQLSSIFNNDKKKQCPAANVYTAVMAF